MENLLWSSRFLDLVSHEPQSRWVTIKVSEGCSPKYLEGSRVLHWRFRHRNLMKENRSPPHLKPSDVEIKQVTLLLLLISMA